jgi:hypothetical protein
VEIICNGKMFSTEVNTTIWTNVNKGLKKIAENKIRNIIDRKLYWIFVEVYTEVSGGLPTTE